MSTDGIDLGRARFARIPISQGRPENVLDYVVVDVEFLSSLRVLGLDWWYVGDRRQVKSKHGGVTFRRHIPLHQIGKVSRNSNVKHYNLMLHRVIAVGLVYGSIPTSFPELIFKTEGLGEVRILSQWDYTRGKLEIMRGTRLSSQRSPGVILDEINVKAELVEQQEVLALDSAINLDDWDEDHLPKFMFKDKLAKEIVVTQGKTQAELEEETRAWDLRHKEEKDFFDKLLDKLDN